ncbi:MAG TPA: hypothetical protein VNX68_04115 [Nitrosopumilaceae archaeon]|jgi:hypothetical protein|nr:hypothetical protein [Nitrosopumilaceae archaeon]
MVTRTRVWTITCPMCHVEMFSRARHDYRTCGCPFQAMIDGGFAGYVRYGGQDVIPLRESFRYRFVKASKQELYDDWNCRRNRFGIIAKKGAK